jgi:hypothetical protein
MAWMKARALVRVNGRKDQVGTAPAVPRQSALRLDGAERRSGEGQGVRERAGMAGKQPGFLDGDPSKRTVETGRI